MDTALRIHEISQISSTRPSFPIRFLSPLFFHLTLSSVMRIIFIFFPLDYTGEFLIMFRFPIQIAFSLLSIPRRRKFLLFFVCVFC